MFLKLLMTTVLGLCASSAFADQMGPKGDKFYEEAARFENACRTEPCRAPYNKVIVYDVQLKINKISANEKSRLKKVAFDQAQIWGDTILEGDYYAAGRTRLDQVVAYYKHDKLVGYKIQYSEKAWYTGDCDFDGSRESLKGCKEGRIVEGSYVSSDVLTYFSDEERYAEFSFIGN